MPRLRLSQLKELIKDLSGASAVGVAAVAPVDEEAASLYDRWIDDGCAGGMAYLERYGDVRRNPALLLDGARSVIVCAFSYANPDAVEKMRRSGGPLISEYALGDDYHTELRQRLKVASERLTELCGGATRICVDTAPLRERYWARQAGLGFIGINNYLILPDLGMHFVLGTILWTEIPDDCFDEPDLRPCKQCMKCVQACPGKALDGKGRLDARKCLSYLTIEHRGEMPQGLQLENRLFGCDTCRRICPHEPANYPETNIPAFVARPEVVALTRPDWCAMTADRFNTLFRNSPLRRAGLPRLLSHL